MQTLRTYVPALRLALMGQAGARPSQALQMGPVQAAHSLPQWAQLPFCKNLACLS